MILSAFTFLHVVISLVGIGSGFVVVYGLLASKRLDGWTATFLWTTVATSVPTNVLSIAVTGNYIYLGTSDSKILRTQDPVPSNIVGDIDGDGAVGQADLTTFLADWGTTTAAADLNANGHVDIYDLSILLTNWGQGSGGVTTPTPIAGQGYSLVYDDEFNSFNTSNWTDHIWYENSPPAGAVTTSNGNLVLTSSRANGFPEVNVSSRGQRTWTEGYFEASFDWNGVQGSWPAFWLFSEHWADSGACPPYASELDVFEGQGLNPNQFWGTLHRNTGGGCGLADQQNGNNFFPQSSDIADGFHTYAALWTNTQVCWYLDNRQLGCTPDYDSTDQPMFLILTQSSGGDFDGSNAITGSTPDLVNKFDWVRVWQK